MISTLPLKDAMVLSLEDISPSAPPVAARSLDMLSLKHVTSVPSSIDGSNNAYANMLPVELMLPASTNKVLPQSTLTELMQRLTDAHQGRDIDKIEQVVVGVAALCGAEMLAGRENQRRTGSGKEEGEALVNMNRQSTEHVEGRNITLANGSNFRYSNVMGNMGILDAFTDILKVLNRQEAHFNASAAQWSQFTMNSARVTGQHMVNSAQLHQTGAIVAGALNIGLQGGASLSIGRSLQAESRSIENNLKRSHKLREQADISRNNLQHHHDNLVNENINIKDDVSARLINSYAKWNTESAILNDRHQQVSYASMITRTKMDVVAQASRSAHDVTQGIYDVKAAEQTKEAEIMRANQTVSGEVDNVHQQTAKKSSESESTLRQTLLAILNNNNDAISAVASRLA